MKSVISMFSLLRTGIGAVAQPGSYRIAGTWVNGAIYETKRRQNVKATLLLTIQDDQKIIGPRFDFSFENLRIR